MVEDKICGNCCYFENKEYNLSYCHRYPAVESKHELVTKDDWCGEFVSRRIVEINQIKRLIKE